MSEADTSMDYTGLYDDLYAGRLAEDPQREPHEKETGIHLDGDSDRASITSFKKVVFGKLLRHSDFEVDSLSVLDGDGEQRDATYLEFLQNPDLTVIGARGTLPVGCLSLGVGRASDSHAGVVKF